MTHRAICPLCDTKLPFAIIFVACPLLVANIHGAWLIPKDLEAPFYEITTLRFGWPLVYAIRDDREGPLDEMQWLFFDDYSYNKVSVSAAMFDISVCVAILACNTIAVQNWLARPRKKVQFSLSSLLKYLAGFAVLLTVLVVSFMSSIHWFYFQASLLNSVLVWLFNIVLSVEVTTSIIVVFRWIVQFLHRRQ
jgi:hypothetical protein